MSVRRYFFPGVVLLPVMVAFGPLMCGCTYLSNRARDLSDVAAVGVSTGGALMVRASATKLVSLNAGVQSDERFYGFRRRGWRWRASSYGLGFASVRSPVLGGSEPEDWHPAFVFRTSERRVDFLRPLAEASKGPHGEAESSDPADPPPVAVSEEMWRYYLFLLMKADDGRLIEILDVEVGAGALIAGFELIASPGQALDFFTGIFGFDLAGDDA